MVQKLQRINAIDPTLVQQVEQQTWQLIRDRGCLQYDF